MKWTVVTIALVVLSFVGTILGALAFTGNLNADAIRAMVRGNSSPAVAQPGEALDAFARELKDKERTLAAEEAEIREKVKRIEMVQNDIADLMARFEKSLPAPEVSSPEQDEERLSRNQQTATTLETMDADIAAAALQQWPKERAAEILALVETDARADILNEMEAPEAVAEILAELQLGV
jgi:flagellar motility protein MotE (MotC chaperone)